MRLLITTQVLDRNHPILGFFHAWVEALSRECEQVIVVALEVGDYDLPDNVSVHSLGKEKGRRGKFAYARAFWKLAEEHLDSYDAVFVHMNPEYALIAAPLWRGKKVALWYNHDHGSWQMRLASHVVDALLHTSPFAASAGTKKSHQMPAGIDTTVFTEHTVEPAEQSIYFQGRIAPAKRVHVLLAAMRMLPNAKVTLVGPAVPEYKETLETEFVDLIGSGRVTFLGAVPNQKTPELFAAHAVSVNLTAAGNYDKSVLESIACGTPVVVSSPAFADLVPASCYFNEGDSNSLAEALKRILSLPSHERRALTKQGRELIEAQHSLTALTRSIMDLYRSL